MYSEAMAEECWRDSSRCVPTPQWHVCVYVCVCVCVCVYVCVCAVLIGADQSRLEWNQSSVSSTNLAV